MDRSDDLGLQDKLSISPVSDPSHFKAAQAVSCVQPCQHPSNSVPLP